MFYVHLEKKAKALRSLNEKSGANKSETEETTTSEPTTESKNDDETTTSPEKGITEKAEHSEKNKKN